MENKNNSLASTVEDDCAASTTTTTEDNQRAIELEIIKNNLIKYHDEALSALRMGLNANNNNNRCPISQSRIWQDLGYPEEQCKTWDQPLLKQADSSNLIDSDICKIVNYDQARAMTNFIHYHVDAPKLVDSMGGFGHLSMAYLIGGLGDKQLEVVDHPTNNNVCGARSKRMGTVRKNIETCRRNYDEPKRVPVKEETMDVDTIQKGLPAEKVVMLDVRSNLDSIPTIVKQYCESRDIRHELVLKLPIHYYSLSKFYSDNNYKRFLRGIGMIVKCTHPTIQNKNELFQEDEFVQILILKKVFSNNNTNNYSNSSSNFQQNKKVKNQYYDGNKTNKWY